MGARQNSSLPHKCGSGAYREYRTRRLVLRHGQTESWQDRIIEKGYCFMILSPMILSLKDYAMEIAGTTEVWDQERFTRWTGR